MRELEMWMPEDDGGCAIEDDDLTSNNGWSANDMFAKVIMGRTTLPPTMAGAQTICLPR